MVSWTTFAKKDAPRRRLKYLNKSLGIYFGLLPGNGAIEKLIFFRRLQANIFPSSPKHRET